jgi:predicted small secreted protein
MTDAGKLFIAVGAVILIGALLVAGCAGGRGFARDRETGTPAVSGTQTKDSGGNPAQTAQKGSALTAKTCAAQSGTICGAGQTCTGTWIAASDSFSCCSGKVADAGSGPVLTVEPIGMGEENGDLGTTF